MRIYFIYFIEFDISFIILILYFMKELYQVGEP